MTIVSKYSLFNFLSSRTESRGEETISNFDNSQCTLNIEDLTD